ncbi:exodeoxyribonuclease I [Gayadomonas joobiniege]|uniref:exodeoxyribonuclease I n=1 Tax=Gayadomonas joobiniege TaxID=1234606 RepID=UPI00036B2A60|nr:exodeoxyribonuclease I [Gayadomonas joobiniege]
MTDNKTQTILWHDYETWGADPRYDRPAQFAAIRTDYALNEIAEPVEIFCRLSMDYLPNPEACLITGLTPQLVNKKGKNEHEFMRAVLAEMSQPETCVAGYNSIRFDDEVTRYSAFRNFFNPYAREWQNGNSRWDIIDLVRTCYALRPDGIVWPKKDDGSPSFKLEDLAQANGLTHENAHDAVSDVRATIALAKLIKEAQPKLYDYVFQLKNKRKVAQLIDINNVTPLVHVSSKFKASQGCCSWVAPLAWHPNNHNALIALDLQQDPSILLELDIETLIQRLFTATKDLADGEVRPPIKLIHINKCPVLASAKTLNPENAERLGINRELCLKHLNIIKQNPAIREQAVAIYQSMSLPEPLDVDASLYQGFASPADTALMDQLQQMSAATLMEYNPQFDDERFNKLWFRFKGRNYPALMSPQDQETWRNFCVDRLTASELPNILTIKQVVEKIEQLANENAGNENKVKILKALYAYTQNL